MPTPKEVIKRVQWHLDIPVCGILEGVRTHIAAISYNERWLLFYWLDCKSAEELVKLMWALIRLRRKHKCSRSTRQTVEYFAN